VSNSETRSSTSEVSKTEPVAEKVSPADAGDHTSSLPHDDVVTMPTDRHSNGRDSTEAATADLFEVMLHTRGPLRVASWRAEFDAVQLGTEMLSKYINVARGPLKKHGWNYSKAVDLVVKLKKCSRKKS